MALCRPRNMNDEAYNAERIVATGNPCKGFVADLIKRGVQIELCARPGRAHKLGTADLLPGVNVNNGCHGENWRNWSKVGSRKSRSEPQAAHHSGELSQKAHWWRGISRSQLSSSEVV